MNKKENDHSINSNNVSVNIEFLEQENQQLDWNNFGEIPELPTGQTLRFELLSPWDDPNYIGLERIEIFNSQGERPLIIQTFTNSLEYYGNLLNLFGERQQQQQRPSTSPLITNKRNNNRNQVVNNGEYSNNNRKWLCNYRVLPSDSSEPIHITLRFHGIQTLAMIRIWNYSGSRINALKGVRNLRIWLDENCIFYGEICCAVGNNSTQGDTILFTINEEILSKIAEHDEQILQISEYTAEQQQNYHPCSDLLGGGDQQNLTFLSALQPSVCENTTIIQPSALPYVTVAPFRPTTGFTDYSPHSLLPSSDEEYSQKDQNNEKDNENEENKKEENLNYSNNIFIGKLFHIEILENWGSAEYIGLTGINFLGPGFSPIDENIVKECLIRCEPAIVVNEELKQSKMGDLKNLLNGINLTCDTENMWIMDKSILNSSEESSIFLSFTFPKEICVSGISIWNYNASTELNCVGVRCARFYANGRLINGIGDVLLRKAPGFVFFDFVQDIIFDRCSMQRPLSCARPQTHSVAAFIFQFRLLSTWGDEFYIGLNGIELFDRHNKLINLYPQNLAAYPESVNCLTLVRDDPRTSDKLINGINDTTKAYNMWLTPILPNSYARVFIIFDTPTFVTRIRIYNYRKTPERGVRHIALSADDLLLCSGAEVPISSPEATGILDLPLRDIEEE